MSYLQETWTHLSDCFTCLIWKEEEEKKENENKEILRFDILLFTEVTESNACISNSLSPNAVIQKNIKKKIMVSISY